jgi:RHS repeat-associated protein
LLSFVVEWSDSDPSTGSGQGAGIREYEVQVKEGEGDWTDRLTGTTAVKATFAGMQGLSYTFQVRAIDNVGNEGAWVESEAVEISDTVTKYYQFGGQRVAMRRGAEVYFIHGDHLGSTSLTTDSDGAVVAESRYLPYGQERWRAGAGVTDFGFTSQRREGFGLYDYLARMYSPSLGRFISPDSIVPEPGNSLALNRYMYVYGNPLNFTDTTGHCREEDENYEACMALADQAKSLIDFDKTWDGVSLYDLNWTTEEQVQRFAEFHNELPGIIEDHQQAMDFITNELGPKPDDVKGTWNNLDKWYQGMKDGVRSNSRDSLRKLFERNPEWQEPMADVGSEAIEFVVGEVIIDTIAAIQKGVLLGGTAVAEATNVSLQIAVTVNMDQVRNRYQGQQPRYHRGLHVSDLFTPEDEPLWTVGD